MTRDELRSLVNEISVRQADPDGVMAAIDAYVAAERAKAWDAGVAVARNFTDTPTDVVLATNPYREGGGDDDA